MPSFDFENKTACSNIAGVDEVGRGPLAGPVIAAAVVIQDQLQFIQQFSKVKDSKKLTVRTRQLLFDQLIHCSFIHYGIGEASVEEIDAVNILNATFLAMKRAVSHLSNTVPVDVVLVDGPVKISGLDLPMIPIVKGDDQSYSIASASIIAKVFRDNLMSKLSLQFPAYKWDKNAGYGTKDHLSALDQYGITPYHRKTYAPVKNLLGLEKSNPLS